MTRASNPIDASTCYDFAIHVHETYGGPGMGYFACLDYNITFSNSTSLGSPMGAYSTYQNFQDETNINTTVAQVSNGRDILAHTRIL